MIKVWITRTEPGVQATAARVTERGYTSILAPLLTTTPCEVPPATGQDIAFTSANGPRFYSGPTTSTAWCVGDATARAARDRGFTNIITGPGDVAGLTARMVSELRRPVLHWAGAHIRGDLVGTLNEAGHSATRIIAYRATRVAQPPLTTPADIALFHSPRAADSFVALCPNAVKVCVSISPNTDEKLAALSGLTRIIATEPNEDAMMAALENAANALT